MSAKKLRLRKPVGIKRTCEAESKANGQSPTKKAGNGVPRTKKTQKNGGKKLEKTKMSQKNVGRLEKMVRKLGGRK